ncbi:MAG: hypothetical protein HUK15_09410 [Bacteroidales bacterium]|nr:hypothetical protein [Bacteroidales bacterium]
MPRSRLLSAILLVFAVLLQISCGNAVNYKQVHSDLKDVNSKADKSQIDSILNAIPTYKEICKNLRLNNVTFDQEALLDCNTIWLYQNSKETAVALGMLVADLGYARYFEKVQTCTDILDGAKALTEKLAVENDIFDEYLPKIEENINNEQVIFETIDSLLNNNSIVPTEDEKYGISALGIAAFWLEVTHLGLYQEAENNDQNDDSLQKHFNVLTQINRLLASIDDNDLIADLKADLIKLENAGYNDIYLKANIEEIRNKYLKLM